MFIGNEKHCCGQKLLSCFSILLIKIFSWNRFEQKVISFFFCSLDLSQHHRQCSSSPPDWQRSSCCWRLQSKVRCFYLSLLFDVLYVASLKEPWTFRGRMYRICGLTPCFESWIRAHVFFFCALQQVWQRDGNPPVCGGRYRRAEESHRWHQHEQDERRGRDRSCEGGACLPEEEPWECESPAFSHTLRMSWMCAVMFLCFYRMSWSWGTRSLGQASKWMSMLLRVKT